MDPRSHPAIEEWMLFLRGETAKERSTWLATHVKSCAMCMKVFASLEAPVQLLGREFPPLQLPSPEQWLRLSRRIQDALRTASALGAEIELEFPAGEEAAWFAAAALAAEQAQEAGAEIGVSITDEMPQRIRLAGGKGSVILTPAPETSDKSGATTEPK